MVLSRGKTVKKKFDLWGINKKDPSKYIGEWKEDNMNGQGVMVYMNGDTYDGQWTNNLRNGQGTEKMADGVKYIGKWSNDNRNGLGVEYYVFGGIKRKGFWRILSNYKTYITF